MGVIVTKDDNESKLQQRIAADLRNRVQNERTGDDPDFAEDADYVKDLKKTSRYGWVWAALVVLAVVSLVCIVFI